MNEIQLTDKAIKAALLAGAEVMKVYSSPDFEIQTKHDHTPVTKADFLAQKIILSTLLNTNLPTISEESEVISFAQRKDWKLFWMIDPLDGTKEFINRNGEFTVNIALIDKNSPVAGVIYVPESQTIYVGIHGEGSWKLSNPPEDCTFRHIQLSGEKLPVTTDAPIFTIVSSRSHQDEQTRNYIESFRKKYQNFEWIKRGSSLKICMVAEGTANIYPKFGTTMEWDTAAGHAILKASGKNIFHHDLVTELTYNKQNLKNPHFIAI
jgi:3'(2'), 5'-bisphosphate nucleotidase